jgi:dCMP deaminase
LLTDDDIDLLRLAARASWASHDNRSQNGCVIIDAYGHLIAQAANRFPDGTKPDLSSQDAKRARIQHAERAAIYEAARKREQLVRATLYAPFVACNECAKAIIDVGIDRVVGHKKCYDNAGYWAPSIELAIAMFEEAGVKFELADAVLGVDILFRGEKLLL